MPTLHPTIGRIVQYRPLHDEGSAVVPLLIVKVMPDEFPDAEDGLSTSGIGGHAFLDAGESYWVEHAQEGAGPGQWFWPERV
jgi:hypothetical protein